MIFYFCLIYRRWMRFKIPDGASLTNIIDVIAHIISLFQESWQLKNIYEISTAEPIDVQVDESGNDISQMYQLMYF